MSRTARGGQRHLELDERDQHVLQQIHSLRLVTTSQLTRLAPSSEGASSEANARRMRRQLASLHRRGLIERLQRRIGGIRAGSEGTVYRLTTRGSREIATHGGTTPTRVGRQPGERFIRHILAVSELCVRVTEYTRIAKDAELASYVAEPASWRHYLGSHGERRIIKPDAAVVTIGGEYEYRWLVEIDLATEGMTTIATKCEAYIAYWRTGTEQRDHGVFPQVLWVVPHEPRARQIERVIQRLTPEVRPLFAVATAQHAATHMFGEPQLREEGDTSL